jgi:hypothetical protein
MEYKVGDWVRVKYTGQHCHGFEHSTRGDIQELQIILWNDNNYLSSNNDIKKGSYPLGRWNSFRNRDGKPVLFSSGKSIDYILGHIKPNLSYEIY